jgi:hypothetical protein
MANICSLSKSPKCPAATNFRPKYSRESSPCQSASANRQHSRLPILGLVSTRVVEAGAVSRVHCRRGYRVGCSPNSRGLGKAVVSRNLGRFLPEAPFAFPWLRHHGLAGFRGFPHENLIEIGGVGSTMSLRAGSGACRASVSGVSPPLK